MMQRQGSSEGSSRGPNSARPRLREPSRVPPVLIAPAVLALLFLLTPLVGLLARAPWRSLPHRLAEPTIRQALRLSLYTATSATAVALLLGVPLAVLLAHGRFPGRSLLRAAVTVPLVLPPVVGGVALLAALGRNGILGRHLYAATGWSLPFTTSAVIVAETFVSLPFLVIAVEGALRGVDQRYSEAAATLGANRWRTFRTVTLPLVLPGVTAGAVLCWA